MSKRTSKQKQRRKEKRADRRAAEKANPKATILAFPPSRANPASFASMFVPRQEMLIAAE